MEENSNDKNINDSEINDREYIIVSGAKENNLKNVSIAIPKNKFVVVTGLSGSGKSSLAFDTICEEGRRLYMESLNSYTKQFEDNVKPDVDSIRGLSPTISIDQKTTSRNPRSTVATSTEIYDYLRILFVHIGIPHSPATNLPIHKQTPDEILEQILKIPEGSKVLILSPIIVGQKGEHRKELISLRRNGYKLVRIDGIDYQFSELPVLDKNKKHTIELILGKVTISDDSSNIKNIKNILDNALSLSNGVASVEIFSLPEEKQSIEYSISENSPPKTISLGEKLSFSEKFACPISGFCLTEIEPRIFSFNSPYGACQKCDGLGNELYFSTSLVIPDPSLSLKDGAIAPWRPQLGNKAKLGKKYTHYESIIETLSEHYRFDLGAPFEKLDPQIQEKILYGGEEIEVQFLEDTGIKRTIVKKKFNGVINYLQERIDASGGGDDLQQYRDLRSCSSCKGYRLRESSLYIKIDNKHIGEVCEMTINNCITWFNSLKDKITPVQIKISDRLIKEITKRLTLLSEIGVGYLSLNRKANTLSGGESQRIRLATQIGSGLSSIIYILDEPSIGLHQSDNDNLLKNLKKLRDQGNTVIVVEHDEDTIQSADYIVDVGPGAGSMGGEIVAAGTPEEIIANPNSITGKYLSGEMQIKVPKVRREINLETNRIEVIGASEHNLQNINVKIPLNAMVVVSGVSGSGKSTFVINTLYPTLLKKVQNLRLKDSGKYEEINGYEGIDKIIEVDQSPIGRTPRSNPATYINVFTAIRELYAAQPDAKMMGYNSSRFSFNIKGGRCEACEGDGVIKVDMYFMPEVYIPCEHCKGKRYNSDTLKILYQEKSIADVLEMTTDSAVEFFKSVPVINEKLLTLQEVGLGYIKLGQSATTLSGGEAQRIKLAKELSRKSIGHTLYIFDEPTTGLHSEDVRKLMKVINSLVDCNNSVIIIEHNLDVIKIADYVIDFGPAGGDCGGRVVACGRPEEVAVVDESITGKYLAQYLREEVRVKPII